MNQLTENTIKSIFDFSGSEENLENKMDLFEKEINRSKEGIERNSFKIAACLYGVKKLFDYFHSVTRERTTYTDIYEYAEDRFGFKKTSTKNAINIIETYFNEDGTLKTRFFGFGYSQLVELLPFKEDIPETVTAETTVKAVREIKKASQTSDLSEELTPLEELSSEVDEKPYVSHGLMGSLLLFAEGKAFKIVSAETIGTFPGRKPIEAVLYDTDVEGVGHFNKYLLKTGEFVAVASYGNVYYRKNSQTSDQTEEPDLIAEEADEITEEDIEEAIVEEIDGNPDEIDGNPDEISDVAENTTNGLDYLLKGSQTSDLNDKDYDRAINFTDNIIEGNKPTLHLFKNKKEREDFIKDYKPWGVWKELPELGLKFYRYEFANGAVLIVTECPEYHSWAKEKWVTTSRHCLILKEDYELPNSYGSGCCRAYDLSGTAPTYIIDYMTKFAKEI